MRDQIIQLLQQALPEQDIPADLADDTDFVGELGLDSLDMLTVATALEKAYAIRIEDVEWSRLSSLNSVLTLVRARLATLQPTLQADTQTVSA